MTDYRDVLKRIGFVLLAVAFADFIFIAYQAITSQSFSVSLNLLAIVVAIFLIRGGLKTARFATWLSAVMLTMLIGGTIFITPFLQPLDLLALEFRLNPASMLAEVIWHIAFIALLIWTYQQLRTPSVLAARREAGQNTAPPKLAVAIGAVLVLLASSITHIMLNGESAAHAEALAKAQHGAGYDYQVVTILWRSRQALATLKAYNEREIKLVEVVWQR